MAFCKYCGRQLSENEICNCRTQTNTYTPDVDFNSITPETETETPVRNTKKLSGKNRILIPLILLVVIFIFAGVSYSVNAYKRPLKNIVRGINKNNIELILQQIMTKDKMEDFKENVLDDDMDWKDFCEDTEDGMEELKEYIEDDFGKHFKVSAEILSKKDAKKREIKNIEKFYDSKDMEFEIKKAYKLKAELNFKGKEEEKTMKLSVYSVKLDGEGWKLMFDEEMLDDFEYDLDDVIDTKTYREIADDIF